MILVKAVRATENTEVGDEVVTVQLPGPLLLLGCSCDGRTVSLVVQLGQFPACLLYCTAALLAGHTAPLSNTTLNTSSSALASLAWNPALPDMFTLTFADGSLALYTVTETGSTDCLTLQEAGAAGLAWSPKGKQLVVVRASGELVQYKPDLTVAKYPKLKEMKRIPGPGRAGLAAVSVAWLSTYEFMVGMQEEGGGPGLWLVRGSKAGDTQHTNYEDICYSTGEGGTAYTSLSIPEWGLTVVGSSTSLELGVMWQEQAGAQPVQWILEDNARAELPLDSSNQERYPVGLTVDFTAAGPRREAGDTEDSPAPPAAPLLLILSSDGLLCPFYCVNTKPGAASLSCQAEALPGKERPGTVNLPAPTAVVATPTPPPAVLPPTAATPPAATDSLQQLLGKKEASPNVGGGDVGKNPSGFGSATSSKEPSPALSLPSTASKESTPVSDTTIKLNVAIQEEMAAFEAELNELRGTLGNLNTFIGTNEDKVNICKRTENCSKFTKDMIDTTQCQNTEIFSLRSSTLETFSWLEEARARESSNSDTKFVQLLRARPLDPRAARRLQVGNTVLHCLHHRFRGLLPWIIFLCNIIKDR